MAPNLKLLSSLPLNLTDETVPFVFGCLKNLAPKNSQTSTGQRYLPGYKSR